MADFEHEQEQWDAVNNKRSRLTLNEYQEKAMNTCLPSSENFSYMMLNLVGEVGEFASKIAKAIRKEQLYIGDSTNHDGTSHINFAPMLMGKNYEQGQRDIEKFDNEVKKELGDIMWQVAGLCSVMGWTLEDVCQQNLDKLQSRLQRDVIDGNGDNR